MYKILITRELPFKNLDKFNRNFSFEINKGPKLSRKELIERVKGKDGLICTLRNKIDAEIMDAAGPQLRVISNYAVGYDNIDVKAASERNIIVTNTPDVLTETTADLAWGLLMSIARRIIEAHNFILEGKWKDWHPLFFAGRDVYGKTLGIIGLGRIGTAIAKRARCFNMEVIYYSRTKKPSIERELNVKFKNFENLLKTSDFIVLTVPLTEDTKNLIDKNEFKLMKRTAYIINVSRGPIINEEALIYALKNKLIAGAALDVFEKEPIDINNPLLQFKNVVLTPHIGSATFETRTLMAKIAIENAINILIKNYEKAFIVNKEVIDENI